ncbi:MAG: redox-sensing transcriptional repressor Rex [Clostridia bacterium]|nr:redox-sensing transcriptional repressor Rex [Clostridia bacterium]
MSGFISDAVVRRLPAYYRHLRELEAEGITQISSQDLGERMQLTPSQIRQDINSFGGLGRQGFGYPVKELKDHIRRIMGLDRLHRMVIIGAGRMGLAIANYSSFSREGFPTVAVFDEDLSKVLQSTEELPIYPIEELEARLPELEATVAVLAVPAEAAQKMMDRLYAQGIRAVWNFAPVDLNYPRDAVVMNVHLSDSLHILSYRMNQMEDEILRAERVVLS